MAPGWWKRLTTPSPVVSPTGTYTDVGLPPRDGGYRNFEWDVTVRTDPSPDGYFWSHQFGFVGGDQGYCGLQTHNAELGGKIAISSIWSSLAADGPEWSGPFGGEGTGYSARIRYDWRPDVTYRLRVQVGDGVGFWAAGVTDTSTGATSSIGQIVVPPAWA